MILRLRADKNRLRRDNQVNFTANQVVMGWLVESQKQLSICQTDLLGYDQASKQGQIFKGGVADM